MGRAVNIRLLALLLGAALLIVSAAVVWAGRSDPGGNDLGRDGGSRPELGLFTTLPIYWNEAADLGELLHSDAPPHWARVQLEERFRLKPLDILSSGEGDATRQIKAMRHLLVAQPRPLSPAENVALDGWVRDGGRVLLFVDPMLTAESTFALGDKRRPQDVALLSPILARWGLRLEFDEAQPSGPRNVHVFDGTVPVELAGRLAPVPAPDSDGTCILHADGLVAQCRIGQGRALILADAAVLDGRARDRASHQLALALLLRHGFAD